MLFKRSSGYLLLLLTTFVFLVHFVFQKCTFGFFDYKGY
jgi:hypothetical protein